MIYFDEDTDGRTFRPEAGTMTETDLKRRLRYLKESSVSVYIVNVCNAKANFPSRVFESYLDGFDIRLGLKQKAIDPECSPWFFRRNANFQALFRQGIDSNSYLLDRAREIGISPWIGVRMNDIHNGMNKESSLHSRYWREHPELWCAGMDRPWENTLDYSHGEVRERMKGFISEVLERYNGDGLLLDFLRWPSIVPYGKGPEKAPLLTDFIQEVKALCEVASTKWKHPVKLVCRVPLTQENALKLGLDAVRWIREGLLDELVIGTFRRGMGFDVPVEEWHEQIGKEDFPITVSIDNEYATMPGPFTTAGGIAPRFKTDPETVRGIASAAYCRGAYGIELFNFMSCLEDDKPEEERKALLHDSASPKSLLGKDRLYRLSWDDSDLRISDIQQIAWLPGYFEKWMEERKKQNIRWTFPLPRTTEPGKEADFVLRTGPLPEEGAEASLHLMTAPGATAEKFILSINGKTFPGGRSGNEVILPFSTMLLLKDRNQISVSTEQGKAILVDVMIRLHFPVQKL